MRRRRPLALAATALILASCGGDPRPSPTASTTTPAATITSPAASAQIPGGLPAPLPPGTVASPDGFEPPLTFIVPEGWYGSGDSFGFGLGKGIDDAEQRFDEAGIQVEVLAMAMDEATSLFAAVEGIVAGEPTSETIDGRPATRFQARPVGDAVGLEALGTGADINEWSSEQVFVDLGDGTLFIRTEIFEGGAESEIADVLASMTFAA